MSRSDIIRFAAQNYYIFLIYTNKRMDFLKRKGDFLAFLFIFYSLFIIICARTLAYIAKKYYLCSQIGKIGKNQDEYSVYYPTAGRGI